MKKILAIALCLATPAAFAQTCAAPGGPDSGSNVPPAATHTGNTCTDATDDFGSTICGGQGVDPNVPVAIYQINVGATNSFNISVADTAPFDAALALIGPTSCSNSAACAAQGNDANAAGGGETLPDGGGMFPTLGAGVYYAAVFSFNTGANRCGAYTLTVNPTLPVQLQSFTVG